MLTQTALDANLSVVKDLEPSLLWQWFATIASIAHPSHHEEALATYIVDWAKTQNLVVWRDEVGNIIIKKPASEGMQHRTPMVLQAHLDMVPQANVGVVHDFSKDPLTLRKSPDGKWLMATDTTLGADNGIGMASCLALLQSDLPHPPLEVLLTMTEETGMVGAFGLQAGVLTAPIMINTDTEEIGEVYVGCAGGIDADVALPLQYVKNHYDGVLELVIKGLRGGHSGLDIHKNRGNAIKLMARLLASLLTTCQGQFALVDVAGGTLRNAIARESRAVIVFDTRYQDNIVSAIQKIASDISHEIAISEPKLTIAHQMMQTSIEEVLDIDSTTTAIHLINALPSGVIRFSDAVTDTVETSVSLGVASIQQGQLQATLLTRSLIETGKEAVCTLIESISTLAGATVEFSGDYVGWNVDTTSAITALTSKLYADILGREPDIKVIHAGLECGLIKKNYPEMDMVSIGPTIKNAHSPDECVDIESVEIYWRLLTQIVANSPMQQ